MYPNSTYFGPNEDRKSQNRASYGFGIRVYGFGIQNQEFSDTSGKVLLRNLQAQKTPQLLTLKQAPMFSRKTRDCQAFYRTHGLLPVFLAL